MSTFKYAGIELRPVLTKRYNRQVVLHGPTYLYTRHTIRVQGLYNPEATSYKGSVFTPTKAKGAAPNVTDATIRHILMQPREQLLFTTGYPNCEDAPAPLLDSSRPVVQFPPSLPGAISTLPGSKSVNIADHKADANFGPFPIACDVIRVGPNTWWVDFAIRTDINECYRYYSNPPFVLSNRWNMTHDIDINNFTTRYVRGRAIFRTDLMLKQNITPDMYRAAFFFPLPDNFQRENVRVWVNEDGNELHYSFVDRQKSHTILLRNITRIEAWASMSVEKNANIDTAARFVGANLSSWGRAASNLWRTPRLRTLVQEAGNMAGTLAGSGAAAYFALQPQSTIGINVRVWGNSLATRKQLYAVANKVYEIKMPQSLTFLGRRAYGSRTLGNFDLMGRYVDLSVNLISTRLGSGLGVTGLGIHSGPLDAFPELLVDDIGEGANAIATTQPAVGKTMPNGNGTRGTYIEMCVAQALQNVCGIPHVPTAPPIAPQGSQYNTLPLPS